jgi:release factor glutamine methyltransferase
MKKNQAFDILAAAGGVHAARIITAHSPQPTAHRWWIYLAAWRLRRKVPVAKIINQKWFYGLPFYTNGATLDPRPDSETLVEAVLGRDTLPACPKKIGRVGNASPPQKILDLGTGTGNLICAIVKNLPGATGVGIDKSWRACRVARRNVRDLRLKSKIKIIRGDFCKDHPALRPSPSGPRPWAPLHRRGTSLQQVQSKFPSCGGVAQSAGVVFDIIISNPPYIAIGDARVDQGARHDPKSALYAGADGLDAYRAIAARAKNWLRPDGRIYLEIGADQGSAVREIFAKHGWNFAAAFNDLSGIERVLSFRAETLC